MMTSGRRYDAPPARSLSIRTRTGDAAAAQSTAPSLGD